MKVAMISSGWRAGAVCIVIGLASLCAGAGPAVVSDGAGSAFTGRYAFLPDRSTLIQTGGFAGVHRIYVVQGQFQLGVDSEAGTASFVWVDANAVEEGTTPHALDPNQVFAMTSLEGMVLSPGAIVLTGKAADNSDVRITATLEGGRVHLVAQTVPPPNSADFFVFSMDAVAQKAYSGGTGTEEDPYQIATAADLILLGKSRSDRTQYVVLTADIDLDPNLPGLRVFHRAVIPSFNGVFDGKGHTISHLTIRGEGNLGLFGRLMPHSQVRDLAIVDCNVTGSGHPIGGLAGRNRGAVSQCYSLGTVRGGDNVGGLVGYNDGAVSQCYSLCGVRGRYNVGGLVGYNNEGAVIQCYSTGAVNGRGSVGGLVARNNRGAVTGCFWDVQTSGQGTSDGGLGKTTAEMQRAQTFLDARWDFAGETANGTGDIWWILEGQGYPRLSWEMPAPH